MELFDQINQDLKEAMKSKNKVALSAIRNIKKYLLEAKTAQNRNGELTNDAIIKIIQKLIKQGKDSAELYQKQDRKDLAQEELEQVAVMEKYLPEQLSTEEIKEEIKKIISDTNASSMKDMGKVMGIASKKMAGVAEGKVISQLVKELLS